MQVSDHEATFSPMLLVFLELDTDHCHLDLKVLDENSNVTINSTFYFQLLNKDHQHTRLRKKQNLSGFKSYGSTGPQTELTE